MEALVLVLVFALDMFVIVAEGEPGFEMGGVGAATWCGGVGWEV